MRLTVMVVDNLSPFTDDIINCLGQLGETHFHRRFFEVCEEDLAQCEKVILSGRRKYSKEINAVNSRITRYCQAQDKPILGICYGAEIIALTLGGSISKMPTPSQGLTEVSISRTNPLTRGKNSILVYESHRYAIAKLPSNFISVGSSECCQHEVFCSHNNMIYGTQFHPEKSGDDGRDLLKNFLNT